MFYPKFFTNKFKAKNLLWVFALFLSAALFLISFKISGVRSMDDDRHSTDKHSTIVITSPSDGERLQGIAEIYGRSERVYQIEFYLKQSIDPKLYIGKTEVWDNTYWHFKWDTQSTPNGEYYLLARSSDSKDITETEVKIIVDNPIPEPEKSDSSDEITEEMEETMREIDEIKELVDGEDEGVVEEEPGEEDEGMDKESDEVSEKIEDINRELDIVSDYLEKEIEEIEENKEIESLTEEVINTKEIIGEEEALEQAEELTIKYEEERQTLIEEIEEASRKIEASTYEIENNLEFQTDEKTIQIVQKTKQVAEKIRETAEMIKNNQDAVLDTDGDGLSDISEAVYGTNPNNPDSDHDGYLDGIEIQHSYDPLDSSPVSRIVYEEPKTAGVVKSEIYQVAEVNNIVVKEKEEIVFKGKGLPNSFVVLYIYSELPIIITAKVDSNGQWSYNLSKALDNGEHEVYVAITNNKGEIVAKSEPHDFYILEAKAVSQETYSKSGYARFQAGKSKVQSMIESYALFTLVIILIVLFIALWIIERKQQI